MALAVIPEVEVGEKALGVTVCLYWMIFLIIFLLMAKSKWQQGGVSGGWFFRVKGNPGA